MKYESNTPMFSKDIARKPFFVRTGRTYVRTYGRTDKGDTICPPIINGGGIKKESTLDQRYIEHHTISGRIRKTFQCTSV